MKDAKKEVYGFRLDSDVLRELEHKGLKGQLPELLNKYLAELSGQKKCPTCNQTLKKGCLK